MKEGLKKLKEVTKDLSREDILRQLYYSLNAEKRIPWQKYDPTDRSIESHVTHLITDGEDVWLAQHAYSHEYKRYEWYIEGGYKKKGVSQWAPINLPGEE